VIDLPGQPLAERILRGALDRQSPPQQFLFFGPPGTGKAQAARAVARHLIGVPDSPDDRALLDLSVVRATGANILLADLEVALADLAARPVVGKARVVIIEGAERLRENDGAQRLLKPLEEPPLGSYVLLVTDVAHDLLPTVRSRCMPVPFRPLGWKAVAAQLTAEGVSAERAEAMARADGTLALAADAFTRAMREVGAAVGVGILRGDVAGPVLARDTQRRMETAAADNPSSELTQLRRAAADLEGKRGGRTATKRAEDQEKRERRRMVSDGWRHVLDGAAAIVADGLAVAVGADGSARHRHLVADIRAAGPTTAFCERALDDMALTRSEFDLNPTSDLAVEAMLSRIATARRGESIPLVAPGRLPW
jgi:DNA polymerase III subunit delta'